MVNAMIVGREKLINFNYIHEKVSFLLSYLGTFSHIWRGCQEKSSVLNWDIPKLIIDKNIEDFY
jgi:hypothetical protein